MKIDKQKLLKNKLLKLKLIETKIYKNNHNNNDWKISDIVTRLKTSLNIVYKYHTNNKRILFIGDYKKLNNNFKKLFKNSKHILLPKSVWMNGLLTNQKSCFKYLRKNHYLINKKFSKTLFQFSKKIDLIVLLDSYYKTNILNEGYIADIPIISLGSSTTYVDLKASYIIPGNFKFSKKIIRDHVFYLILSSLLKKANKNIAIITPKKYHKVKKSAISKKKYR